MLRFFVARLENSKASGCRATDFVSPETFRQISTDHPSWLCQHVCDMGSTAVNGWDYAIFSQYTGDRSVLCVDELRSGCMTLPRL